MALAQGIRSQLLAKTQTAFGTTAVGNYTKKKFVTHSLELKKSTVKSATIRSDREISDFRHTTKESGGDIVVELSLLDFEDLIASAMFNVFASGVINIGTTPQFLTLEDGALDISQYRLHKDVLVSKWVTKMTPGAIVTSTFSCIGSTMGQAASTGGGTAIAAGTNAPFDSLTGQIWDDAAESGTALGIVTGLDLTVDNSAKAAFAVGNRAAAVIEYGPGDVSGQMTFFYQDAVMANRFINETEFGLSFALADPTAHGYEFQFPRIKLTAAAVPVANPQSRIMTVPFQALKPTSGPLTSALTITAF